MPLGVFWVGVPYFGTTDRINCRSIGPGSMAILRTISERLVRLKGQKISVKQVHSRLKLAVGALALSCLAAGVLFVAVPTTSENVGSSAQARTEPNTGALSEIADLSKL